MFHVIKSIRTLCATVLAVAVLMVGCGSHSSSSSSQGVVNINPAALLESIENSIQQPIARALAGWDWDSYLDSFGPLLINLKYTLDMQKVTYQSTGADGKVQSMTGLLILPRAIIGGKPSVPILMYQHGTEVYRPYSPSQYLTHLDRPTDHPEVMVAAAIASTGYAVALVDYEGMGDNTSTQPHVVGATLAQQVIDLLKASRNIIGGSNSPCTWNTQLFLMGFSEGGYVTMVATRELQLNHAAEFTVTASASLSGPHDLSGVMRGVMLSDSTFKAPYFVPMLLTSYNYAYGGQTTDFSPDFAMIAPFNSRLPLLFDGKSQSDTISEAMGMSFTVPTLIAPKKVLTADFINKLTNSTAPGSVFSFLQKNDSYRGWVPTVPIRMIHHKNDELVPYANSQVAFDTFVAAGATSVELVEETATISISSDPVKTVHIGAAFPELSHGWQWLDSF